MFHGSLWESLKRVFLLLAGVGLLGVVAAQLSDLLGLLPLLTSKTVAAAVRLGVLVLTPIIGTLVYVNWRWGWKPENMGLARRPAAVGWVLLGLLLGLIASGGAFMASWLMEPARGALALPGLKTVDILSVALVLVSSFAVELLFRGAVVSRYQTDLTEREVLIAGIATPFAWLIVTWLFSGWLIGANPGIGMGWEGAMSVALTLVFLRSDSVWFTAGIRAGMYLPMAFMAAPFGGQGAFLVWGVIAAVLVALELLRQNRAPRRVRSGGRGGRGPQRPNRGQTIRGPWGPH